MKKRNALIKVGAMVALVMGTTLAVLPANADNALVVPNSATPNLQNFTDLGQAPSDASMTITIFLKLQNQNGLQTAIANHQHMSASDFRANYSPNDSQYNAVINQLQQAGLTINAQTTNHLAVNATGTVAQIQNVLGTTIHQYQDANGKTFFANNTDFTVTGALNPLIAGASGVNQYSIPRPKLINQNANTVNNESVAATSPQNFFSGTNSAYIQKAYNFTPVYNNGIDGSGQTIAIVDAYGSPTIQQDLQVYNQQVEQGAFGANEPLNLQVITPPGLGAIATQNPVKGTDAYDWAGEVSMDVELSHAVAPGAKILLVATPNNQEDLYMGVNHIVDNELANQVSLSFGGPEFYMSQAERTAVDQIFEQAEVEGINVFVSSGDWGDFSPYYGFATTSFPASDPNVIAVGGSSLFTDSAGNYSSEFEWGEQLEKTVHPDGTVTGGGFWMGAGGGTSSVFAKPSYQSGVAGLSSTSYRQVPDVGYDSDPFTGFTLVHAGSVESGWGGTSDAAPQWAAICALANQGHVARTGAALPYINPILYANGQAGLHDVQHGSLEIVLKGSVSGNLYYTEMGSDTSLSATPGWDDTTGLGTPDVNAVVNTLVNSN